MRLWSMVSLACLSAFGCGGGSPPGGAAEARQEAGKLSFLVAFPACYPDYERLCPEIDSSKDARQGVACLYSHEEKLNPVCQEQFVLRGSRRRVHRTRDACAPDREQFCADAPTKQEALGCLFEHEDELSPPCKQMVAAQKKASQPGAGGGAPQTPMGPGMGGGTRW